MEIKRPVSNIPAELREINLGKEQEQAASDQPVGVASVADSIESATANIGSELSEIFQSRQQTSDATGQKELGADEQQIAANFNIDDLEKPSFFVEGSSTRHENSKNAGPGFLRSNNGTSAPDSRLSDRQLGQEEILKLNTAAGNPNEAGDAENDRNRLLQRGNFRDALNQEVNERHEEANIVAGGSTIDRLKNVLDPTASIHENTGPAFGKDMISQSLGIDPTPEEVQAAIKKREESENATPKEPEKTLWQEIKGFFGISDEQETAVAVEVVEHYTPVPVPPTNKEDYENTGKGLGAILNSKNRTPQSETLKGVKSYDPENYQGNIPDEIRNQMDYQREKFRQLHQDPGGQEIQTDPNSIGTGSGFVDDGIVHVGQLGITGLVGQPDPTDEGRSGPGSGSDPGGSSGGNIDFGPDSNETGWSGTTHQEDPRDVQLGPASPVEQSSDTEEEEDSSTPGVKGSMLDQLIQKKTDD